MNNYLWIIDAFNYMSDKLNLINGGNIKIWLVRKDTGWSKYISDLINAYRLLEVGDVVNILNEEDYLKFNTRISNKEVTREQAFEFYTLIGAFELINDNNYRFINRVDFDENFIDYFFETITYKYSNNLFGKNTLYKMVHGLILYSIWRMIGSDALYEIINDNNTNENVRTGVISCFDGPELNNFNNETYRRFFENYIENRFALEDIEHIVECLINGDEYNHHTATIDINAIENQDLQPIDIINNDATIRNILSNNDSAQLNKKSIRQVLSNKLRAGYATRVKAVTNGTCDLRINNLYISERLTEVAHIYSVENMVDQLIDFKDNDLIVNNIIEIAHDVNNALVLPFNYHKLYDSNIINIDYENGRFNLNNNLNNNELDCARNVWGFNDNNFIEPNKMQRIIRTKNRIDEIIENINTYAQGNDEDE